MRLSSMEDDVQRAIGRRASAPVPLGGEECRAMANRKLSVVLWIAGIGCLLSIFGVVLPWSWLSAWVTVWGLGELPAGTMVVYAVRAGSATFALVGVFFLLLATDPVRYRPFLNLGIAGLILVGLVCLVSGVAVGMQPPWYLTDVAFCWILGILLFVWREPARSVS